MSERNSRSVDTVRALSRDRVLAAVHSGGAVSRAELGRVTGLSRGTIAAAVADLLAAGALVEGDASGPRQPGRPARHLAPAPRTDLVVAVDFGHSHCRIGIVRADGTAVVEDDTALDVDASAELSLAHARRVVRAQLRSLGADRARVVGGAIGLPAPVHDGTVEPGNVLPGWVGCRPADELAAAVGIAFTADNDANLGALAEARFGAGVGVADLVYVKVSTGIGAGLVLGGRLHRGTGGRAGEIGHVPVDPSGAVCRCGNRGCLETMASVRQVLAALQPRNDRPVTVAELSALVAAGDPGAVRVVGDAGLMVGRVLADTVNGLNPSLVVLGGELSSTGTAFVDGVRESIERYAQPGITRDLTVVPSHLGARTQLIGAAALALAEAAPPAAALHPSVPLSRRETPR